MRELLCKLFNHDWMVAPAGEAGTQTKVYLICKRHPEKHQAVIPCYVAFAAPPKIFEGERTIKSGSDESVPILRELGTNRKTGPELSVK